ncbi:hypothetical protein GCM10009872_39870 [Actinopolymorpha rutila]
MGRPPVLAVADGQPRLLIRRRSADVDVRAAGGVGFGAAEDFAGDGGHLADAEEEEAQEVRDRIAFGPLEVDVGPDGRIRGTGSC